MKTMRTALAVRAKVSGQITAGTASVTAMSMVNAPRGGRRILLRLPGDGPVLLPNAAAASRPMTVIKRQAEQDAALRPGTGQVQARLVISAAAQQAPTTGPVASSLRAARRAGAGR